VPERIEIASGVAIDRGEIELRASRSSGPGGQHANVTASRVEARFDVNASRSLTDAQKRRITSRLGPVVTAVAQDTRSQLRNRELAIDRVASRLGAALRPRRQRRTTKPTRASKQRRLEAKRRAAQRKAARRKPRQGDWE
jgi:ribosome-associated protein